MIVVVYNIVNLESGEKGVVGRRQLFESKNCPIARLCFETKSPLLLVSAENLKICSSLDT